MVKRYLDESSDNQAKRHAKWIRQSHLTTQNNRENDEKGGKS